MHCPYCDLEHPDDSLFCPNTGRVIDRPLQPGPGTPGSTNPGKARKKIPVIVWLGLLLGALCLLVIAAAVVGLVIWKGFAQEGGTPAAVTQPTLSGQVEGRIVFVSNRDGHPEIYVMNADGSQPIRLTDTPQEVHNDYPAWSPNGQKIAFVSDRGGNAEIYVMNADGSDPLLLRDIPAESFSSYDAPGDFRPVWSPDGQKLAFVSALDGVYKICVMDVDGSNRGCLADTQVGGFYPAGFGFPGMLLDDNETNPEYDQTGLSWCADGQTIVYGSSRSGDAKIYTINTNDGAQSLLTDQRDFSPDCSADALKIAFSSDRGQASQIYVMNIDGSAQTTLTREKQTDSFSPSWAPDGLRIVFQSNRDGNAEIYVMNADGSQPTRLTDNQAQDWHPDWSPSGTP